MNVKVNKHVLEGSKLPTIIKKETVENISLVDTNGKEYRPVNLKRDFMSPIPFQTRHSDASTPIITPIPALNREVKKVFEDAKLSSISGNDIQKERFINTSFPSNNVKDYDETGDLRRHFMSPIPFQGCHSKASTPCITRVRALNREVKKNST